MLISHLAVSGRVGRQDLAKQFAWLAAKQIEVPVWLSTLSNQGDCFIVGRDAAFESDDFVFFRKRLLSMYEEIMTPDTGAARVPEELEGLLNLTDAIFDTIFPPEEDA